MRGALRPPVVMAVGGLDPSGGAGLLADAATVGALGGRPLVVATAITVQSMRSVARVVPLSPRLVTEQAEKLFDEEAPGAVKLGMLAEAPIARALAKLLGGRLGRRPLVIDPVLQSSSGARLFRGRAGSDYGALFALARVVTPNLGEAAHLLGESIGSRLDDRVEGARELSRLLRCAVILKGGHATGDAHDVVADGDQVRVLRATRVTASKRGTGCRFASALATGLAGGDELLDAARVAKAYVRAYLRARTA